jgi:hypothetical protein
LHPSPECTDNVGFQYENQLEIIRQYFLLAACAPDRMTTKTRMQHQNKRMTSKSKT